MRDAESMGQRLHMRRQGTTDAIREGCRWRDCEYRSPSDSRITTQSVQGRRPPVHENEMHVVWETQAMTWLIQNWFPVLIGWTACAVIVTTYLVIVFRINPRES